MRTLLTRFRDAWPRACLLGLGLSILSHSAFAAPPPVITVQPLDDTVVYEDTALFTVTATSGTAMTYQWYKEGIIIDTTLSGQTASSLTINNVASGDAGKYYVKISNAAGTTTSRHAVLAVVANSAPVATNDTYSTSEDTPLSVAAGGMLSNDYDANGHFLMAFLATNVSQGTLSMNTNGAFTYTPPANYSGTVAFSYRATDNYPQVIEQNTAGGNYVQSDSGEAVAQSFRHGISGGSSYFIKKIVLYLSRENKNASAIGFSVGTNVNSGTIAGSTVSIPYANITDTSKGNTFQTFSITYSSPVGPFNAGTTYYLNLDNQSGKKVFLEYPNNNSYANGTFYFDGSDQGKDLRFQIYEPTMSNPATVTINILPVNDPPVAVNDATNILEDTTVTIPVLRNDSDVEGSPLTIVNTVTTNSTAIISGTNVLFIPATNYYGIEVFHYVISDGSLLSTAKVTVTISPVNDAPIVVNDVTNVLEDNSVTVRVLANDSDVEGSSLTLVAVATTNGFVTINGTNVVYTPATNFNGQANFSYIVSDGALYTTGRVAVIVVPVNDAPFAVPDVTNTSRNTTVTIGVLANDWDIEGTALSLIGVFTTNGIAIVSGTNVLYTPATNFSDMVSLSYTNFDGTNFGTGEIQVNILPNDPPIANNDTYTVEANCGGFCAPASVLSNDLDLDGDSLSAVLLTGVTNGTLNLNTNGMFSYTPANNYVGTDSFTYRATDGTSSSVATVKLTVLDPASLNLRPLGMTTNGFSLEFSVPVGSTYVILASTNNLDWVPILTNVAASLMVVVTDTEAANFENRYYRALVP